MAKQRTTLGKTSGKLLKKNGSKKLLKTDWQIGILSSPSYIAPQDEASNQQKPTWCAGAMTQPKLDTWLPETTERDVFSFEKPMTMLDEIRGWNPDERLTPHQGCDMKKNFSLSEYWNSMKLFKLFQSVQSLILRSQFLGFAWLPVAGYVFFRAIYLRAFRAIGKTLCWKVMIDVSKTWCLVSWVADCWTFDQKTTLLENTSLIMELYIAIHKFPNDMVCWAPQAFRNLLQQTSHAGYDCLIALAVDIVFDAVCAIYQLWCKLSKGRIPKSRPLTTRPLQQGCCRTPIMLRNVRITSSPLKLSFF